MFLSGRRKCKESLERNSRTRRPEPISVNVGNGTFGNNNMELSGLLGSSIQEAKIDRQVCAGLGRFLQAYFNER